MTVVLNQSDAELAGYLAEEAGKLLIQTRISGIFEGKELGKVGDQRANKFLCDSIRDLRPHDGLLSEEEKDTKERLSIDRVWIIDPVDGTREYGEGRSDWAVHVGLAIEGEALCGAVALPGLNGGTLLRNDQPRPMPKMPTKPRLVVSRTRPAREAVEVSKVLDGELIPMGSAGAKAMAIVLGQAEIYLHSGGQFEWDSCAPVAVAKAHGLHCSRIDGSPLIYNREDTYMPDLLICRQELAVTVLSALRQIRTI
jgi:3'(2'), 5'-bisphosphate nucleotidase